MMIPQSVWLAWVLMGVLAARQSAVQAVTSSFSIREGGFACMTTATVGNMLCSKDAVTTTAGALKLTPDPPGRTQSDDFYLNTYGMALYNDGIKLLDSKSSKVLSFSSSFSLRVERNSKGQSGDGMTWVMLADRSWIGVNGASLAVFGKDEKPGTQTLAVEFDTFLNKGIDNDTNHVGIDISGPLSEKVRVVVDPDLSLLDVRVYGWVDYDASAKILQVRISNDNVRPGPAFISYNKDLSQVFDKEVVWVGFSGSNTDESGFYGYHTAYNLNFNTSESGVQGSDVSKSSVSGVGLIAGAAAGGTMIILGFTILAWCCNARRHMYKRTSNSGAGSVLSLPAGRESLQIDFNSSLKMYTYKQLSAATKDFHESFKTGEGGFGSVYRGVLQGTGELVVVKKLRGDSTQGHREFVAEVTTISQIRHRNIVRLLGCCCEGRDKYGLVYEFMVNGSLDNALFKPAPRFVLSWEQRYKILGGLAAALQYLHEGWRQQVIHRDVKSSNVMLDDDFNAMLGDFGLARINDHKNMDAATTSVAGTVGYLAPEASFTGKFTVKTDVYAFGAVALEIVCGRRSHDRSVPPEQTFLVDWVWERLSKDDLFSVVDRRLLGKYGSQQVEIVLLLGLLCSHPQPSQRPGMNRVIEILAGSVEMPAVPKSKPEPEYHSRASYRAACSPGVPSTDLDSWRFSGSMTHTSTSTSTASPSDSS